MPDSFPIRGRIPSSAVVMSCRFGRNVHRTSMMVLTYDVGKMRLHVAEMDLDMSFCGHLVLRKMLAVKVTRRNIMVMKSCVMCEKFWKIN